MNIDFESMTDAEINRWVATQFVTPEMAQTWGSFDRAIDAMIDHEGDWATSADAALELCERWGIEWKRNVLKTNGRMIAAWGLNVPTHYCAENSRCKFPRALLNAACAARHAKEMADATN